MAVPSVSADRLEGGVEGRHSAALHLNVVQQMDFTTQQLLNTAKQPQLNHIAQSLTPRQ